MNQSNVSKVFGNLESLHDDMKAQGKWSFPFKFSFRGKRYFGIVWRFTNKMKRKNDMARMMFVFLKANNVKESILVEANTYKLFGSVKDIREFFGIPYDPIHLGNAMRTLCESIGMWIPLDTSKPYGEELKSALIQSTQYFSSEKDDASKIYCIGVYHNNGWRTIGNDTKARERAPLAYQYFGDDWTLSFHFTDIEENGKLDEDIITEFMNREVK